MKHLWEIAHPYYCKIENYFSNDTVTEYSSFDEFLNEEDEILSPPRKKEDHDLNLIFRWDWILDEDEDGFTIEGSDTLYLFYMQQRRGAYVTCKIKVNRTDEDRIIEFLKPRWLKLKELWKGISNIN